MKKILISLIFITLFCSLLSAKTYNLANKDTKIILTELNNRTVYFSSIINTKTNRNIILKTPSEKVNLWTMKVKPSKEFMAKEIELTGNNAKKVTGTSTKNKVTITWSNVKDEDMASGFDVIVTGEATENGTYWDIDIKPLGNDYGIWNVTFPNIMFNFENNDEFFSGIYGGMIENTNPYKDPTGNPRVSCQYPSNMPFQMCYVTREGSGIYMCPEDNEGWHKIFNWPSPNEEEIFYNLLQMPNDQGVGGVEFKQAYKFNISAFEGDWYDAIKKYRKWAIEAKVPSFKNGPLTDRNDVPQWLKENCFWGNDYQREIAGRIPTAFHLYSWWHLPHDVGYPEMLPANEETVQSWIRRKNGNTAFKLIYYTNPHLIDSKNSDLYKQYGNEVVSLMANMQPRPFDWAKDKTINYSVCPSLDIVKDTIVNLQKTLVTKYDADSVYLDEINTIAPDDCYNEKHGHPLGTGNRWTKEYNDLMERIMKECSQAKGEPIAIFSEGPAEPFVTVACLDLGIRPFAPYAISALYSGYRFQWAMQYNAADFEGDQTRAIAKMAWTLNGGWQLGWYEYLPAGKDYKDVPNFTLYQKNACLARYKAVDYMNLGEMVRPVKITSPIDNVHVQIALSVTDKTPFYDVPSVQTSSWNFNGKTAVILSNITNKSLEFTFESTGKDLNLPEKDSYKITKIFPTNYDYPSGPINVKTGIEPYETLVFVIE